jgi:outer membrane immunogenic protein
VGAGAEYAFTPNWSVKAEYLYVDLGAVNNVLISGLDPAAIQTYGFPTQMTTRSSQLHDNIVRVGLNYHPDTPGSTMPAPAIMDRRAASAAYSWSGFYGGINAGGALARNPTFNPMFFGPVANFPVAGLDSYSHAPVGGLIGGQVGWNWRVQPNWVVGAEADLQWLHQSDSACISECLPVLPGEALILLGLTDAESMKWLATLRGRAGWIAPNNTLWYATGGVAWSQIRDTLTVSAAPPFFAPGVPSGATFSHDRIGWTIGGGVEIPMWDRWSIKAEYLYVDLGKVSDTLFTPLDPAQLPSTFLTSTSSFSIHDHIVRAGLNYHLN